jgi:ATP-dependent Clp protease ATP-binding subunit ClpX
MEDKIIKCIFCGKEGHESSDDFIKGTTGNHICVNCIDILTMLREDNDDFSFAEEKPVNNNIKKTSEKLLTPSEIKAKLDENVIGQEEAKKVLSIAAYNYHKRIEMIDENGNCPVEKSNILLIGPTGTGKTYLTETLAKIMNVPFVTIDITSFSETGYKGNDPSEIIKNLYLKTFDPELTERGIVFIDEIDKIAGGNSNSHVSDTKVQQGILKIIEGTDVVIKDETDMSISINTKNILFICSGAFVGLDEIIKKRINKKTSSIGFGASVKSEKEIEINDVLSQVTPEDLFKFGMTPELIGRLHCITTLQELKKDDLKRIITEPKSSIFKQYETMFKYEDVKLEIEEDALEEIANRCLLNKTGARGIRSILEKVMVQPSFDIPSFKGKFSKCIITADAIKGTSLPKYVKTRKPRRKKAGI